VNGFKGLTGALRAEVLLDEADALAANIAAADRDDLPGIQARLQDIIGELRGMVA